MLGVPEITTFIDQLHCPRKRNVERQHETMINKTRRKKHKENIKHAVYEELRRRYRIVRSVAKVEGKMRLFFFFHIKKTLVRARQNQLLHLKILNISRWIFRELGEFRHSPRAISELS